ncbi:MAG: hypothetical protein UZ18_ATM001000641 [Armatimonadetes bacterium OLB18]|nr:MAG: hypothetical protein UZ18_ATM001000641 [Armatimonadetes bacterium OLB18]
MRFWCDRLDAGRSWGRSDSAPRGTNSEQSLHRRRVARVRPLTDEGATGTARGRTLKWAAVADLPLDCVTLDRGRDNHSMAAPAFPMLFRRRGDAMKTANFRYGSIVLLALGAACLGQAQSVSFEQVNWADGVGGYLAGASTATGRTPGSTSRRARGLRPTLGGSIRPGSTWSLPYPGSTRTSGRS